VLQLDAYWAGRFGRRMGFNGVFPHDCLVSKGLGQEWMFRKTNNPATRNITVSNLKRNVYMEKQKTD
jgi:hypothetical protein